MLEGVSKIQHDLTNRIEGKDAIDLRADRIKNLVSQFHEQSLDATNTLRAKYDLLKRHYHKPEADLLNTPYQPFGYEEDPLKHKPTSEEINDFEDVMTAYLVFQLEEGKSPGNKVHKKTELMGQEFDPIDPDLDLSKEYRLREDQIKSIVALLRKDHLQSPTGSGKSSVILPISALVKAISENGRISVVSASHELTAGLEKALIEYNELLPEDMQIKINMGERQNEKGSSHKGSGEILAKKLMKREVEQVDDPEIAALQFKSLIDQPPVSDERFDKPAHGEIIIFKDDDFVFWKMRHKEAHIQHTYWDEIHVPYDRGSPYYVTSEGIPTANSVNNYLFDRIMSGIVAKEIAEWEKDRLIEKRKKRFDIRAGTKDGEEQGERYTKRQEKFYSFVAESLLNPKDGSLNEVVSLIASKLDLDAAKLEDWFRKEVHDHVRNNDLNDIITEHNLALMRAKAIQEGREYSVKNGSPVSRDPYMGISLPDRKYHPDIYLALQSLQGEADYFNFIKSAADMTTLEGFMVNHLQGKISGLSGTLMTPTLSDPTPERSPLARLLEKYSNHSVFSAEIQKPKYIPTPQYFEDEDLRDKHIGGLIFTDPRPVAVFTFDEIEGERLEKKFKEQFPDREVLLVSDDLDETAAQKKYQEFADSTNALLISTGRAGVGVDIKKSNSEFPDFLTVIDGLPQSRAQFFQIIGRRRRDLSDVNHPDRDFAWMFSREDLVNHSGIQTRDVSEINAIDDRFHKFVATAPTQTLQKKDILAELDKILNRAEAQVTEDDTLKVLFDGFYAQALKKITIKGKESGYRAYLDNQKGDVSGGFYEKNVEKRFTQEERRLLESVLPHLHQREEGFDLLKSFFYSYVGAPASLYYDLKNLLNFSQGESADARLADFYPRASALFNTEGTFDHWLSLRTEEFVELMKSSFSTLEKSKPYKEYVNLGEALRLGAKLQVYYLGNETDPPEGRRAGEAKVDPQPNGYRSLSLTLKNQGGQLRQFQLLVRNDDPRSTDIYRPLLLAEDRVLLPWDEAGLTNLHLGLEVLAKK